MLTPYLAGEAKTGLNSSYTSLNAAITNLLNSINTAIADGKNRAEKQMECEIFCLNTAYASSIHLSSWLTRLSKIN